MTKADRELLIRIDEGMKHLRKSHDEHKEQTEEKLTAIQSEQIAQGKQIATLKEKNKPFLFKLFAAIFAAKGA